jgi:hypothetical protein
MVGKRESEELFHNKGQRQPVRRKQLRPRFRADFALKLMHMQSHLCTDL